MTNRRSSSGRELLNLAEYQERVGHPPQASRWLTIDQAMVSDFARVTGDDSFIHVDPEAAAKTRFGGTIAHGLLLLSLLPRLMRDVAPLIQGTAMGANYGYEKVRFLSPVPTDSHIRAWFGLAAIEERQAHFLILRYHVSVEVEGQARHALTADWLIARWMKREADEVSRQAYRQDHSGGAL